jgi:hypothetical protein
MPELERTRTARNGLPGFRPYVYKGTGEDIYRGAAGYLSDVRRQAITRHEESLPDPGPSPEWYRELAEDGEMAELAAERDRYQAAMAAVPGPREPDPAPAPPPVTAASRCRRCGYLTTAVGHKVACDE